MRNTVESLQGENAAGFLLLILFMAAALGAGWFAYGASATV